MAKKKKNPLKNPLKDLPPDTPHNRIKNHIIMEGSPIPPLVDMGVFTQEGKVAAPMQHKFRQINRFLEMVSEVLPEQAQNPSSEGVSSPQKLSVVDFGCGKSYLTFVLYYYLTEIRGISTTMVGLDLKAEVIAHCEETARRYGYEGLSFMQGDIGEYSAHHKADMVIALHACDTATDYALYHGIQMGASRILVAPCCQHELKTQIKGDSLSLLTRYGAVKERSAALMTDAIRANLMAYRGYRTQLMEFVELTHTPKNLLIRAVKTKMPLHARNMYLQEVDVLCETFGLKPLLYSLLVR